MKRVIIMGAAGRDFHNFNVYFRDNPNYKVVAFTATQIPNIEGRRYPAKLAGKLYPKGIPIEPEENLRELIAEHNVDLVVFSYSDVSHQYVMERASWAMAAGADFMLLGPKSTQLKAKKPVISVTAVRTGSGKSQTTRRVADILRKHGKRVVVVRHPMPYGDLVKQECQRFASFKDLDRYECTIEEREEYEPHLARGTVVYAGVDYEKILRMAEREADVILWDGGNNDFSFFVPDMTIVVADPLRAGHEVTYFPGHINLLLADVVVINKVDTASRAQVERVRENIRKFNPKAKIIEAASPIFVEDPSVIEGKRVLAIEDGPTLTHGEMPYGAATLAAEKYGAKELVDPRPYAVNSIAETFRKYPHIGKLLPAMGYGEEQIRDLAKTIKRTDCDAVIIGTPIDLKRLIKFDVPTTRVLYELQEIGHPTLEEVLEPLLD
jgi:predicted GTPase